MDEQFENWQFFKPNFGFPNLKNSRNLLIFQFGQFQKLAILKISKMSNSENSENFRFGKFWKSTISKILKNFNFETSKNF